MSYSTVIALWSSVTAVLQLSLAVRCLRLRAARSSGCRALAGCCTAVTSARATPWCRAGCCQASLSGTDRTPFETNNRHVLVNGSFNQVWLHEFKTKAVLLTMLGLFGYMYLLFPNLLGSGIYKLALCFSAMQTSCRNPSARPPKIAVLTVRTSRPLEQQSGCMLRSRAARQPWTRSCSSSRACVRPAGFADASAGNLARRRA